MDPALRSWTDLVRAPDHEIDLAQGYIRNLRSGYEARLPPMARESLRLIQDGGIANYTRRILEERRKASGAVPG